jgi:hypothetical protein
LKIEIDIEIELEPTSNLIFGKQIAGMTSDLPSHQSYSQQIGNENENENDAYAENKKKFCFGSVGRVQPLQVSSLQGGSHQTL